jgi:HK97 family phage portal protein
MDLLKGLTGLISRKELGYPSTTGFIPLGGRWVMLTENYSTYIDSGFKALPALYGIVDHICEKVSDAPSELYQVKDLKKARGVATMLKSARTPEQFFKARMLQIKAFDKVEDQHPFYKLMDSPNPITPTEKAFKHMRTGYLALTGNSYSYSAVPGMGPNATIPRELWIVPSPTCQPIAGDNQNPIEGYKVSYYEPDTILPERMQHVKLSNFISNFSSLDEMLVGTSPVKPLISTITQLNDAFKANGTAFQNMAPAGVLNGDPKPGVDPLSEAQGGQLQDGFLQRHTGAANWKKILVSPARLHWTQIGFSPVDMQILEFMDKAEEQIAKVYHYPLGLLNSKGEVANESINSRRMITDAVMPYIRRFDDADTQSVRSWYNNQNLVVMTDLQYYTELQEDMAKVVQWLKDAYWLSMQEKRKVMDYEEQVRSGDTVLVPSNLMDITELTMPNLDGGDSESL